MKRIIKLILWVMLVGVVSTGIFTGATIYFLVNAQMKFEEGKVEEGIALLQKNYDMHVWLENTFQKIGINLPFIRTQEEALAISKKQFMKDFTHETTVVYSNAKVLDLKIMKIEELGEEYFYIEFERVIQKQDHSIVTEKGYAKYQYGSLVAHAIY